MGKRKRRRKYNKRNVNKPKEVAISQPATPPKDRLTPKVQEIIDQAVASVAKRTKKGCENDKSSVPWLEHGKPPASNYVTSKPSYSYDWISPEKAATMTAESLLSEAAWAKWMERVDIARNCLFYAARKIEVEHYLADMERYNTYGRKTG